MNTHHLILGTLTDFLSGAHITDTHDERYRQKIARILVQDKGFAKEDIEAARKLAVTASGKTAVIPVDFLVSIEGRVLMLVKYGPGSLVTRHRSALAISRLMAPYQIPVVVAANGEDADILCGLSGRIRGRGFEGIPDKPELARISQVEIPEICARRREMESRIVYAFEVDGSCPCDSDICRIEP